MKGAPNVSTAARIATTAVEATVGDKRNATVAVSTGVWIGIVGFFAFYCCFYICCCLLSIFCDISASRVKRRNKSLESTNNNDGSGDSAKTSKKISLSRKSSKTMTASRKTSKSVEVVRAEGGSEAILDPSEVIVDPSRSLVGVPPRFTSTPIRF
ncbi:unnamed protein product [Caenorhabditis auriculariae]|uniref:Transmembrane protein n=1 Tax=Caenorhabditis auriculariae TaxID=2777116 RepID=A0A8S1HPE0_9PELO|nr:unnamed protein product [Caenorhabditis auriculariae]